jgi:two-component system, NtrC family, sensor kinase
MRSTWPGHERMPNDQLSTTDLLHLSRLITTGRLSACFAHEVTHPLMLIRGHLRFIEEALGADHPLRVNLEAIDRAERRIEDMAKRMLDFTRKGDPISQYCDAEQVISDALGFIQPYFRSRYINVRVHAEPGLPVVKIDRFQIIQALVNLLQNSAEAMSEMDKRVLTITAKAEGTQMRIAITDTGSGISAEDLPRVFEPFFTTKGERGTGLGLFIVKDVIEQHNGAIDVRTGATGTTFIISLPL